MLSKILSTLVMMGLFTTTAIASDNVINLPYKDYKGDYYYPYLINHRIYINQEQTNKCFYLTDEKFNLIPQKIEKCQNLKNRNTLPDADCALSDEQFRNWDDPKGYQASSVFWLGYEQASKVNQQEVGFFTAIKLDKPQDISMVNKDAERPSTLKVNTKYIDCYTCVSNIPKNKLIPWKYYEVHLNYVDDTHILVDSLLYPFSQNMAKKLSHPSSDDLFFIKTLSGIRYHRFSIIDIDQFKQFASGKSVKMGDYYLIPATPELMNLVLPYVKNELPHIREKYWSISTDKDMWKYIIISDTKERQDIEKELDKITGGY